MNLVEFRYNIFLSTHTQTSVIHDDDQYNYKLAKG